MSRVEIEQKASEHVWKNGELKVDMDRQLFVVQDLEKNSIHMFPMKHVLRASSIPTPNSPQ